MSSLLRGVDPTRPRSLIVTAALVGLVAGLLAALFLSVAGEPALEEAIALEAAGASAHDHDAVEVSRDVQKGPGLFGAYALTGAGFGVLLALTFLALRRSRPDLFRCSLLAAAVLGGAITVAPWLKYPPNPPGVGEADTLGERQALYLLVIVLALALLAGATVLAQRLRAAGWPEPRRVAVVAVLVVGAMLLAFGLLPPAPGEIDVPASLLWRFRLASLGGNLLLWAVLGLTFGLIVATAGDRDRIGPG